MLWLDPRIFHRSFSSLLTGDRNLFVAVLALIRRMSHLLGSLLCDLIPLPLLQELLLALRANNPVAFKAWLSLGIERLGETAVTELMLDWINPILTTDEADRLVSWHLGVSF